MSKLERNKILSVNQLIRRIVEARFFRGGFIGWFLVSFLLLSPFTYGAERCLILNSYHPNFSWTETVVDCIVSELVKYDADIDILIEYMDTKHYNDQEYYDGLSELYRRKYSDIKFEVIIVTDNNALLFVLQLRELVEGLGEIPIVFCGVDEYHNSMLQTTPIRSSIDEILQGNKNLTGVLEGFDYRSTIEVALQLHPKAEHLILVAEEEGADTHWPPLSKEKVDELIEEFSDKIEIVRFVVSKTNVKELIKETAREDSQQLVFLTNTFLDTSGNRLYDEGDWPLFWQECKSPMYVVTEEVLGKECVVGGKINSSELQGYKAAHLVIAILSGKSPDEIPIILETPSEFIFNYAQLRRFGIPESRLPASSVIINRPYSFYEEYKRRIWIVSGIILALLSVVILLSLTILRRRQAERALHESEERFKAIFESSSDCILVWDKNYNYLYANQAAIDHVGVTRDEVIGKNIREGLGHIPEFMELWMSRVDKVFKIEETMRVMDESVINDRHVYSESVFFPIRKEDGRIFAVGVVYRDITARVAAERAFVQSKTRQKAILDNISDIVWLKDLEGRHIDVNEAFCRFMNKTQDEIIGKTDLEIFSEDLARKYYLDDQEVIRSRNRKLIEEEAIRSDGEKMWIETVKTPIFDESGNVIGTTGIARDITERKVACEELEYMAMELEERVKQRTSELQEANEELVKQISEREKISGELLLYQKQLQSLTSELSLAEERLRRKIAVDVHDHIGQKLAVSKIKLKSICQDSSISDKASLDEVCEILSEAIDDSRNLSFELSPPILYELGLCAAIEWLLRDMSEKHGIRNTIECDITKLVLDEHVRVVLFQAMRELVFNVVKHSQAKNLKVKIFCSDNQIEIEMSDDGIGFDISSIRDDNGVYKGFGLFSIKERLGHIGGKFEISSTLGSGTIAKLTSPVRMGYS